MNKAGFDDFCKNDAEKYSGLYEGRVISQSKSLYAVICNDSCITAEVSGKFRYNAVKSSDYPVTGDFVMLDKASSENGNAVISAVLPRKSAFVRKCAGNTNDEQIVAANIDVVFICMSLNSNFNIRRLERYLTLGYDSGAVPVILLTKSDLCEDIHKYMLEAEAVSMGAEIFTVSSLENEGYQKVLEYIKPQKTYAFIGSSGVGKSTLINRLTGKNSLKTSEIRKDGKGRHTTTGRELLFLENGAAVIDTPGMRELGISDAADGLDKSFSDIEELILNCRFSDCTHSSEPGCAVIEAVEKGELSEERWNSYCRLKAESEFAGHKADYLMQKKIKFKNIAKMNKSGRKEGNIRY